MRKRILLAALLLAACKPKGPSPEEKKEIVIGATLPLTGAEARIGGFFKEGYQLAFDEVTKKGGLDVGGKKIPVKLVLLDDTSNPATAVTLADRLINSDKVDFLLGTYATNLVEAQSTVAEQNKVPYVNGGGAASENYNGGYKYVVGGRAHVEVPVTNTMRRNYEQEKAQRV